MSHYTTIYICFSDNATKYCHENGTWASKAVYDFCLDGKQEDIPDEVLVCTIVPWVADNIPALI